MGLKVDIVPETLYFYRFTAGSMQRTTNFEESRRRALRPYLKALPEGARAVRTMSLLFLVSRCALCWLRSSCRRAATCTRTC